MRWLYLVLLTGLIGLFGCQGGLPGDFGGGLPGGLSGGANGLQMKFLQLQPPNELREDQEFTIGLEITNLGQCAANGQICVRDTLSGSFGGLSEECQELNVGAVEVVADKAKQDTQKVFFSAPAYSNVNRQLQTTIFATASYPCRFVAGPQLCIKPVIGNDEDLCKSTQTVSGSDLGANIAPITVTKVEKKLVPEIGGLRMMVFITLSKMNEGMPVSFRENVDEDKSPVGITVNYGGYGQLRCDEVEQGVYLWDRNEDTADLQCDILLGEVEFEENPLNIDLSYNYEISKKIPITIEDKKNFGNR